MAHTNSTLPPSIVEAMARAIAIRAPDAFSLKHSSAEPELCLDWPRDFEGPEEECFRKVAQAALRAALPLLLADMMEPNQETLAAGAAGWATKPIWESMLRAHFAERYGITLEAACKSSLQVGTED